MISSIRFRSVDLYHPPLRREFGTGQFGFRYVCSICVTTPHTFALYHILFQSTIYFYEFTFFLHLSYTFNQRASFPFVFPHSSHDDHILFYVYDQVLRILQESYHLRYSKSSPRVCKQCSFHRSDQKMIRNMDRCYFSIVGIN